eukprot:TRINITY_DN13825_c1_g1_i1.p1 TRINITY_DN13825_c1_g1~~TRINITY_DN13825_c1_g1_i1.p1  ORF type:complete len:170 (+),score=33.02 TRINITY_DN13825_c1_g1_i1:710-1219(+)
MGDEEWVLMCWVFKQSATLREGLAGGVKGEVLRYLADATNVPVRWSGKEGKVRSLVPVMRGYRWEGSFKIQDPHHGYYSMVLGVAPVEHPDFILNPDHARSLSVTHKSGSVYTTGDTIRATIDYKRCCATLDTHTFSFSPQEHVGIHCYTFNSTMEWVPAIFTQHMSSF